MTDFKISNIAKNLHEPYMHVYRWLHEGCEECTARKIRKAIIKTYKLDIPISHIMVSTAFYHPDLFPQVKRKSITRLKNTMQDMVQRFQIKS